MLKTIINTFPKANPRARKISDVTPTSEAISDSASPLPDIINEKVITDTEANQRHFSNFVRLLSDSAIFILSP
jgi:hypothetical protein